MACYLTTALAAQACGVSEATIRDWARRDLLTRDPRGWSLAQLAEAADAPKPRRPLDKVVGTTVSSVHFPSV